MDQTVTPPAPPACLKKEYPSSQKGGTLIAEDVVDVVSHQQRLCCPDGYRPAQCPRCKHVVLHVHDYPWRVLLGEPDRPGVKIIRYMCASCEATWRILPRFLARHLRRTWAVVETAVGLRERSKDQPSVPKRTVERWKGRLHSAAGLVVQALCRSSDAALQKLARRVGPLGSRFELVNAYGAVLAAFAGLVHRITPGVRVM